MKSRTLPAAAPAAESLRIKAVLLLCGAALFASAGRSYGDPNKPQQNVAKNEDSPKEADDPRKKEVEQLIRQYFRSWSAPDMDAYGDCFLSGAVVQYFDPNGRLATYSLKPFLATQKKAQLTARHKQTEVPLSIDIRFEAKLARAVVYWKLTAGPRTDFGYDHFTLAKHRGKWRIVNLVFYEVKKPE